VSGHSRWSTIKRKKAKEDAKRGKIFTRAGKEITIAAREGGGDPDGNPRLRAAVLAARAVNMPSDNIDKAIKRGTGELPGVSYESVTYEGYGPGGVAILIEVLTDNRNRTVAEIRHLLERGNGSMASAGSVAWLFDKKGIILVPMEEHTEEEVFEVAVESGAEDVREENGYLEIITDASSLFSVKEALESRRIPCESAELSAIPKSTIPLIGRDAEKVLHLLEQLEDHDDIQKVYSNFDIPDEVMEQVAAE